MEKTASEYRKLYEKLKEQVRMIEEELKGLEESGEADEYPVKHQKARDKIDEINEQISELEKAFEDIEEKS